MNYGIFSCKISSEQEKSFKINNFSSDDIPSIINNEYLESVSNENRDPVEDLYSDLENLEILTSNTCDTENDCENYNKNETLFLENEGFSASVEKKSPMLSKKRNRRKI